MKKELGVVQRRAQAAAALQERVRELEGAGAAAAQVWRGRMDCRRNDVSGCCSVYYIIVIILYIVVIILYIIVIIFVGWDASGCCSVYYICGLGRRHAS